MTCCRVLSSRFKCWLLGKDYLYTCGSYDRGDLSSIVESIQVLAAAGTCIYVAVMTEVTCR